ncbi:hypothetical protein [Anabaena cylindrica]|uniref:hypothetical protein n=1 Tax=Anabaena cylindrica TaxID=1165 RepID=UPI003A4D210E
MATNHLLEIKQYGQSIWMDNLSRDIAIANAKIVYQEYKKITITNAWQALMDELLVEGIDKFVQPFQSLMNSLEGKIKLLSPV